MKTLNFFCLSLLVISIIVLFSVKDEVRTLNAILSEKEIKLIKEKKRIQVLNADWAMLNEPQRLRKLGYLYLQLEPATTNTLINISDIPFNKPAIRSFPSNGDAEEVLE